MLLFIDIMTPSADRELQVGHGAVVLYVDVAAVERDVAHQIANLLGVEGQLLVNREAGQRGAVVEHIIAAACEIRPVFVPHGALDVGTQRRPPHPAIAITTTCTHRMIHSAVRKKKQQNKKQT